MWLNGGNKKSFSILASALEINKWVYPTQQIPVALAQER
jgi:hypothetical protein